MKEFEKVKTDFNKLLNHKTSKDLALNKGQKKRLENEFKEFSKNYNIQFENFINQKREYIEDSKCTSMTHYLLKLKEEAIHCKTLNFQENGKGKQKIKFG